MSKLSDYSKFDQLDSDTDDDDNDVAIRTNADDDALPSKKMISQPPRDPTSSTSAAAASPATPVSIQGTTKKHPTIADRYIFSYGNQKVYEWEQSLDEVTIYIDAPMQQLPKENTASYINVEISANQLRVGLKGADRFFIDEQTFDKVKVKESSWYLDDGVITIILSKCFRGQTWEGVLCGHTTSQSGVGTTSSERHGIQESIDPVTKQAMQRTMMLERFQEENPGFDFRDATFNGEVPDPRTFMGGVGYNN